MRRWSEKCTGEVCWSSGGCRGQPRCVLVILVRGENFLFVGQSFLEIGGGGGQYLMIAGDVTGRDSQAAVYIVELSTGRVAAIMFNGSNKTLEIIAGRNVAEDANRATGSR